MIKYFFVCRCDCFHGSKDSTKKLAYEFEWLTFEKFLLFLVNLLSYSTWTKTNVIDLHIEISPFKNQTEGE
jgi:hypothetical protein